MQDFGNRREVLPLVSCETTSVGQINDVERVGSYDCRVQKLIVYQVSYYLRRKSLPYINIPLNSRYYGIGL